MRLVELNPRWFGAGGQGITDRQGHPVPERHGVAIGFDCPCGCGESVAVHLKNPIDGGAPCAPASALWERTGEDFETLTLTPSLQRIGGCGWHGFVRNGEIVNA